MKLKNESFKQMSSNKSNLAVAGMMSLAPTTPMAPDTKMMAPYMMPQYAQQPTMVYPGYQPMNPYVMDPYKQFTPLVQNNFPQMRPGEGVPLNTEVRSDSEMLIQDQIHVQDHLNSDWQQTEGRINSAERRYKNPWTSISRPMNRFMDVDEDQWQS